MIKIRKIVNYLSWIVIGILILLLMLNWSSIPLSVVTHVGFHTLSYGNKSVLIILVVVECIINMAFSLGYDIPFIKEIKKMKFTPFWFDSIIIILQILALLITTSFIITAIY